MDHDRIIQAAYYAAIAVGLDPTVRNVTRATAAIRGITGVARPVWSESVRRWLSARPDSRTDSKTESKTIQKRYASDTRAIRSPCSN